MLSEFPSSDHRLTAIDCKAVITPITFTSDLKLMGKFVNLTWLKVLADAVTTIVVGVA